MSSVIFPLFVGVLCIVLLFTLAEQIGAIIYDILDVRNKKMHAKHPYSKNLRQRPLISIIIPAFNAGTTIEACLQSIRRSSYKSYEIMVVDDVSTDDTKTKVAEFMKKNSKQKITLISRRKHLGWRVAASSTILKKTKGSLVMLLGAESTISKNCLRSIVYATAAKSCDVVITNKQIATTKSVPGVVRQFEQLIKTRSQKLWPFSVNDMTGLETGRVYTAAAIRDMNKRVKRGTLSSRYVADALIESVYSKYYASKQGGTKDAGHTFGFFEAYKLLELVTALSGAIVVTYFTYLAVKFAKPEFYGLSWLLVSLWLILIVLASNQPLRSKLRLLGFVPVMYGVLYLLVIVKTVGVTLSTVQNQAVKLR